MTASKKFQILTYRGKEYLVHPPHIEPGGNNIPIKDLQFIGEVDSLPERAQEICKMEHTVEL